MIRRVAVPALQLDPGVSLNPRSAAPSYDFADPLGTKRLGCQRTQPLVKRSSEQRFPAHGRAR
jgi:hypothetical protein